MQLTKTPDLPVPARRRLPEAFDPADTAALDAHARDLLQSEIGSAADLRAWIEDWSELEGSVWGEYSRRATAFDRNTADSELRDRATTFEADVMPLWETCEDKLVRRFLASPFAGELGPDYEVFRRDRVRNTEIFREENTPLLADDRRICNEWKEVQGAVLVELDGEKLTPAACVARYRHPDRSVRKTAFLGLARRRAEDREKIDALFDELLALRHKIARNAGYENFRDYTYAKMHRFDYTPQDCAGYHAGVENVLAPVSRALAQQRRETLGLDRLRPWDNYVNLHAPSSEPLFRDEKSYIGFTRRLFEAVDPSFASDFDILIRNGLLDLMARPGKSPGAYNCMVADMRLPFIFGNAAGTARDVEMLLHEGGHAFHSIAARELEPLAYAFSPAEFAEVASMTMEHFGVERLGHACDEEQARALSYEHFESSLMILPRIALVDAFEHWVFTQTGHTADERRRKWAELTARFLPWVDWSGHEADRDDSWQGIIHLFTHPLYYISYGIAELGALRLWRNEQRDHDETVAAYRRALALGGSRPLPELYETAGITFGMDEAVFQDIVPAVRDRLLS